jgi:Tol biopolymer transport system component
LFPTLPWRAIVAAALILAVVAAGLLIVGSQHRVPPPFGPARNGAFVYGSQGDVYARDTVDGASRLLIGGPTEDFAATFTRDGTHLVFLRRTAGTPGSFNERIQPFSANADGSAAVALTEALDAPDWFDLSPDDSTLVVAAGDPSTGQKLFAADVAHPTGAARPIDIGDPKMAVNNPNFLALSGTEIVFRGRTHTPAGNRSGLFAVRLDGSGLRPLTPTDGDFDNGYQFPQPAPDGSAIAYTAWDGDAKTLRMHVLDLRTGSDRIVSVATLSQGYATFSPDGRRITFVSYGESRNQIMVAASDGTGPQLAVGPVYPQVEGQFISGIFSPDGKSIVVNDPASKETRLVDVATGGDGQILPWSGGDLSGWQRLAP